MEIGQRTGHTPPRHWASRIVHMRKLRPQVQVFERDHGPSTNGERVPVMYCMTLCNPFYPPWNCFKSVAKLGARSCNRVVPS